MTEEIKNIFISEATEQLDSIEELINYNNSSKNIEIEASLIEKVFFTMHSLKGSSPMFGFNHMPLMALPVEKTFAKIRKGELNLSQELIYKTHCIVKHLQQALHAKDDHSLILLNEKDEAVDYFKKLCS